MTTIDQSVKAKGIAIGWFSKNGYVVCLPISRHKDYDILVDNGKIQRVRIISTSYKNESGNWELALRQMSGTYSQGSVVKKFDNTTCDFVFAVCGEDELFLIPSSDINATVKIIPANYPSSRVHF